MSTSYDLKRFETLSDEGLLIFCYDTPKFELVYAQLVQGTKRNQLLRLIKELQTVDLDDQSTVGCSNLASSVDPSFAELDPLYDSSEEIYQEMHASETFGYKYDMFISHANEDKEDFVRPLVEKLTKKGLKVWYDDFELSIGDSLLQSTEKGLIWSRFGVVVLSKAFFTKNWPQYELAALFARETTGSKVILPIWHKITKNEILALSPILAGKYALSTQELSLEEVSEKLKQLLE